MSVQITEQYRSKVLTQPGNPPILVQNTAELPCECAVHVGLRLDDGEAAVGSWPCTEQHLPLIERFNELLIASLDHPRVGVLLIDVVAELLGEAEQVTVIE